MSDEKKNARGELSMPTLWAIALAFLLGAALTGYLGWTLMPR